MNAIGAPGVATAQQPTGVARGQFSLRAVLILTAAAAAVCALSAVLGRGFIVLGAGLLIYVANWLGMLAIVQQRWIAQVALYGAFAALATSMFLTIAPWPRGYEFAWAVAAMPWNDRDAFGDRALDIVPNAGIVSLCSVATLGNLAMLLSPIFAHRLAIGGAKWLRTLLGFAAVGGWICLFVALMPEYASWTGFPIGSYLWCGALTISAVVLPVTGRQFVIVLLLAAWLSLAGPIWWYWIDFPFRIG